jgi:hypothetical protein
MKENACFGIRICIICIKIFNVNYYIISLLKLILSFKNNFNNYENISC